MAKPDPISAAGLNVLFVASECAPYAKCGGLGDVVASLPKALRRLGADARIVLPLYDSISREKFGLVAEPACRVPCGGGEVNGCGIWRGTADGGVPVWFVEHDRFFARGGIYDLRARIRRQRVPLRLLCLAAAHLCRDRKLLPDVVHVHDWPTAVFPALLDAWRKAGTPFAGPPACSPSTTRATRATTIVGHGYLGLGPEYFKPDGLEAWARSTCSRAGSISRRDHDGLADLRQGNPGRARGNGLSGYLQKRIGISSATSRRGLRRLESENDRKIPATFRPNR
jgi:starch synthase